LAVGSSDAGELTFELPDNEKMCFHEYISKGVECVLEFQVIEGGNYDVDMILTSPDRRELYSEQKKQYDQYSWTTDVAGDYQFCFSNEFSTITHKIIYFDFQVGNTDPLQKVSQSPITAMTQMETSALTLYQSLKVVIDYQTHHKLREAQGRSFAEDLNERVQYWSIGQTVVILIAGIGQVLILRSFFTDRKSPHTGSART
jgi:protein ERP2